MTSTTLSTALVIGWFLVPQLAGLRFGWRGVALATVAYAVVVPALSLVLSEQLYLAGSLALLPLMALFMLGLNVALFGLLKTIAELFTRKPTDTAP